LDILSITGLILAIVAVLVGAVLKARACMPCFPPPLS
jgi:hypothetical protein